MKKLTPPKWLTELPPEQTLTGCRRMLPGGHEFGNEFYIADIPSHPNDCVIVSIGTGKWEVFRMRAEDATERLWNPAHLDDLRKRFTNSL